MKKLLTILLVLCLSLTAVSAFAQMNEVELVDPLGGQDIWGIINRAINFLFMMCLYGGLIMIIWAGWTYITSQGDTKKTGVAVKMIQSVLIGLVIVLLAKAIIGFTYYIVTGKKGGVPNLNGGSKTTQEENTPYTGSDTPAVDTQYYNPDGSNAPVLNNLNFGQ